MYGSKSQTKHKAPNPDPREAITKKRAKTMETQYSLVLVIVTGGTITMENQDGNYVPSPDILEKVAAASPALHDSEFVLPPDLPDVGKFFALPNLSKTERRVLYSLYEYDPLLDSSNMTIADYKKIANDIKKYYTQFNGFVVLHGTDTMAYTSSFLSFMFENLGKPVILSGSQIPLVASRSDGVDNLLGSLILAGNYDIPEVTLFFDHTLFRGNRSHKQNSKSFAAFASPNMRPLAENGVDIVVNWDIVQRPDGRDLSVFEDLEVNIGVLSLFPGITAQTVKEFLSPPMSGVVLHTYGEGNGPSDNKDLIAEISAANDRGVLILNCTQCEAGGVAEAYETGAVLEEAGVILGYDITLEAGLAKLSYVIGQKDSSNEEKKALMVENLRGEITKPTEKIDVNEYYEAISRGMKQNTKAEENKLKKTLFLPLLCFAAKRDDIESIKSLESQGADIHAQDYSGRTCLHVAASQGSARTVEYLLKRGASVHVRDRLGFTPLDDAIQFKHPECIKLLQAAGAHTVYPTASGRN